MLLSNFQFNKLLLLLFFIVPLLISSCEKETICTSDKFQHIDFNGDVKKIETLGYYSTLDAVTLLQLANLPGKVETTNGFYLYRITYKTNNFNNNAIWVSGLLAIPDCNNIKGIVCYQHGTNPDRFNTMSTPSTQEGLGISSLFAGNNYILLAPDYIGLGISNEIPTYLHIPSTTSTVIDFIEIGSNIFQTLTRQSQSNLYLVGFSQGGCATAGIQREIESNPMLNINLKASACVAGAYNLKDISIKYAIDNHSRLYLGYVANSFATIYNQNLNSIINPDYINLVSTLFDGSHSVDEILEKMPKEPTELYTKQMIDDIYKGNLNWFTSALELNETYNWKPISPLRLYYGSKDVDVSPQDAIAAYEHMSAMGGNVRLINTGEFDHSGSLINALSDIQQWFNNTK